MKRSGPLQMPTTRLEFTRRLTDAAVAGYRAGLNDKSNGKWSAHRINAAAVRRQFRSELMRQWARDES